MPPNCSGVITVKISDDVEREFRRVVAKVYGVGKGVLGKAIEEAIELWLQKYGKRE